MIHAVSAPASRAGVPGMAGDHPQVGTSLNMTW